MRAPVSCVLCPVSCVLCPVSCVLCAVSCVLCPVCRVLCAVCRALHALTPPAPPSDAFLPNYQERIFDHGCTRVELTYYTNVLSLGMMTVFFSATGDLQKASAYAFANPHALLLMTVYTFLAYIAITFHMALVKEYGGVTTVRVMCACARVP